MRDSVVVYRELYEALKDADQAGEAYNAYFAYALDGEVYSGADPYICGLMAVMAQRIDRDQAKYDDRRAKAKAAIEKRWLRTNTDEYGRIPPNTDDTVHVHVHDHVYVNKYSDEPELDAAIKDFIAHRKKIRKPMTDRAIELFIKNLDRLASSTDKKIELINYAIERGWQTVYPINEKDKKPRGIERDNDLDKDVREKVLAAL